jgi:hypothetical protein
MWIVIAIVVAVVGGGVGAWFFLRNNPNKAKKIEDVIDVIKK